MPFLAGPAAGALASTAMGAGGAAAQAAATQGAQSPFQATPAPTDPNAFRLGGATPDEQAAQAAQAQSDFFGAVHQGAHSALGNHIGFGGTPLPGEQAAQQAAADAQAKAAASGSWAQQEANRYGQQAAAAQGRLGVQADLGQYNQGRAMQIGDRANMADAMGMYKNAADGRGPSAAQAQLQMGLDQNNAAAMSMAASSRGGGGNLALGQRSAMMQMGQNNAMAAQQAAILRAQEQQAGMAGYANTSSQQRAADLQSQGMDAQAAFQQAQLEEAQRSRNDQMTLGSEALRAGTANSAMGGQIAGQQLASSNYNQAQGINASTAAGNAAARAAGNQRTIGQVGNALGQVGQYVNGAVNSGTPPQKNP